MRWQHEEGVAARVPNTTRLGCGWYAGMRLSRAGECRASLPGEGALLLQWGHTGSEEMGTPAMPGHPSPQPWQLLEMPRGALRQGAEGGLLEPWGSLCWWGGGGASQG